MNICAEVLQCFFCLSLYASYHVGSSCRDCHSVSTRIQWSQVTQLHCGALLQCVPVASRGSGGDVQQEVHMTLGAAIVTWVLGYICLVCACVTFVYTVAFAAMTLSGAAWVVASLIERIRR